MPVQQFPPSVRVAKLAPADGTDEDTVELLGDQPAVRGWQPCRWKP